MMKRINPAMMRDAIITISISLSVLKGTELAKECCSDLDVIENIYYFVTQTITYDEEKAQSVTYGYIPNPDETLSLGKGICFDYASLMTAMLRSQQIPTRLEVGYAGEVYHAWISCYVDEIGWVVCREYRCPKNLISFRSGKRKPKNSDSNPSEDN